MEDNFYLRNSEGLVTVDKPSDAILTDFREQCIEMIVFNVGEGEAMLVKARNKAIFIDGGADKSKERNVTLGNALRKYLAGNGIKLNAIVASHNHTDHLNALSTMLSGEDPPILATEACFYCNGEKIPLKLEKTWKKLQKLRKNNKIKIIEISELTPINWIGDQRITMLIDGRKKPKPEYRSIFMHIPYREATFLLTGDAYRAYEKELLKDPNASQYMKTDVLKITHHGSKGGTGKEFLQHANPVIYVASTGKKADHRLEEDVIERIKEYSGEVSEEIRSNKKNIFDTHTKGGDVIIRTDGIRRNLQGYNGLLFEVEVKAGIYAP